MPNYLHPFESHEWDLDEDDILTGADKELTDSERNTIIESYFRIIYNYKQPDQE